MKKMWISKRKYKILIRIVVMAERLMNLPEGWQAIHTDPGAGRDGLKMDKQLNDEANMLLVSQNRVQDLKREIAELEAQDYMEAVMWCVHSLQKLELWED